LSLAGNLTIPFRSHFAWSIAASYSFPRPGGQKSRTAVGYVNWLITLKRTLLSAPLPRRCSSCCLDRECAPNHLRSLIDLYGADDADSFLILTVCFVTLEPRSVSRHTHGPSDNHDQFRRLRPAVAKARLAAIATLGKGYDLAYIWKQVGLSLARDAADYYIRASKPGGEPPSCWWGPARRGTRRRPEGCGHLRPAAGRRTAAGRTCMSRDNHPGTRTESYVSSRLSLKIVGNACVSR
jgi:hypothetical protein